MARVLVHNITDRPDVQAEPQAVRFGQDVIRPGKHALIDEALLKAKHKAMHGILVWFGDLPARFSRSSDSGIKARLRVEGVAEVPPMTVQEARTYLETLPTEKVLALCAATIPPLEFPVVPSQKVLSARLARVLFMDRAVDPEKFFWLRRWVKRGDTYIERE